MLKKSKENKGFTLIEVVIVLAIAALIILVVLQAVGAAQKANRDTTRKSEAARMVSLFEQVASNKSGLYPTAATAKATLTGYDANLGGKYTFTAGAYVVAGPMVTVCAAVPSSGKYEVIYADSPNQRDYELNACLENGGSVSIKAGN
jgi:prepilin-type N-terminal cleavage/methylation domain-containing protein